MSQFWPFRRLKITFIIIQPNPYFVLYIGTFLRKLHTKKKYQAFKWKVDDRQTDDGQLCIIKALLQSKLKGYICDLLLEKLHCQLKCGKNGWIQVANDTKWVKVVKNEQSYTIWRKLWKVPKEINKIGEKFPKLVKIDKKSGEKLQNVVSIGPNRRVNKTKQLF